MWAEHRSAPEEKDKNGKAGPTGCSVWQSQSVIRCGAIISPGWSLAVNFQVFPCLLEQAYEKHMSTISLDQPEHPCSLVIALETTQVIYGSNAVQWATNSMKLHRLVLVFARCIYHLVGFVVRWLLFFSCPEEVTPKKCLPHVHGTAYFLSFFF